MYLIRPLAHWMKTRQPLPACAGTAFNIVISLADPIRCGLSAALAAEIGWTRRPDATWAGYIVRLLPFRHYFVSALHQYSSFSGLTHHERCAPRVLLVKWMPSPATAVG